MESHDTIEGTSTISALKTTVTPLYINSHRKLYINICGQKFELLRDTILKYPSTRLGKIVLGKRLSCSKGVASSTLYDGYDKIKNELYFERDPSCFHLVIAYYVTGLLHVPRHVCIEMFQYEIEYWGIPFNLESCCQAYHQQEWDVVETMKKTNKLFEERAKKATLDECLGSSINLRPESRWSVWKRKTWDLFENHDSSKAATVVSFISSFMVIISTITLCVNTHPDVQVTLSDGTKTDNPNLLIIEIICIFWFTLEYLSRAIACPNKKQFLKSVLNAIDLLAIMPFYIGIIIETLHGGVDENFTDVRRFVQALRIFRIVRIFKVARHSTGLQVLGYTVKNSSSELGLLFMLLIMGMTLFSCLVYYAEQDEKDTKFESIIAAFWWAIITMTTVGYGDMYPKTPLGQIIGSMCCVSGIIFIALPIPTIVSNFSAFYKDHMNKEKLSKLYTMADDDVESENGSDVIIKDSKDSLFHVNTIPQPKLSMAQLERHGHYRRRMSRLSTVGALPEETV